MAALQLGWSLDATRGPDWLIIRLHAPAEGAEEQFELAEALWQMLEQHFLNRVVLEMDDVPMLRSWLVGQLVMLHKRVTSQGGLMRLCGLSDDNYQVLKTLRLDERFPAYTDRGAAVMGAKPKPKKPR